MVVNGVGNVVDHVLDSHFLVLADRKNDRLDLGVVAEHPENELTHIDVVDELAERLAGTPDHHGLAGLLRLVKLVNQTRDDMTSLDLEVVVRTVDVRRNDGGEVAAVFLGVQTVKNLDHTLSVRIAFVGEVRRTVVHHRFVNGIGSLVGENAGRETRDELLHLAISLHDERPP